MVETRQVSPNHYVFSERVNPRFCFVMGLASGRERAALVDAGMGIDRSLPRAVATVTDRPVTLLVTHCDSDHIGGASQFRDVYLSPEEREEDIAVACSPGLRLRFLAAHGFDPEMVKRAEASIVREPLTVYGQVRDGDRLDLGGRELLAISLPGHSMGSMVYLDPEARIAFVGDAITKSPLVAFGRCPPLSVYLEALLRFRDIAGDGVRLYCGHSVTALPEDTLPDLIQGCRDILSGKCGGDREEVLPLGFFDLKDVPVWLHRHGGVTIRYNRERLSPSCPAGNQR